jgi:hypothetical protein
VVNDRTKTQRTVCTTSNLFIGAIHFEHGLGFDTKGGAEAERIALANYNHVFHFSKIKALENMEASFTEADLRMIRAKLAPLTIAAAEGVLGRWRASFDLPGRTLGAAQGVSRCNGMRPDRT